MAKLQSFFERLEVESTLKQTHRRAGSFEVMSVSCHVIREHMSRYVVTHQSVRPDDGGLECASSGILGALERTSPAAHTTVPPVHRPL